MAAILYSIKLQFKMDIRSRTLLITCYVVPLLFFIIMGGIFTSLMPDSRETLIQSMTVMGISMGTIIGLPPSIVEVYGSDIKKMYIANGIPIYLSVVSIVTSAFIHLLIMSAIIFIAAPILFHALVPSHFVFYVLSLVLFISVSLSIACILGLAIRNQAKLTMYSQIIFFPSIMLSGIMFSTELLPSIFENIGRLLPATWGYLLLTQKNAHAFISLVIILCISIIINIILLKNMIVMI